MGLGGLVVQLKIMEGGGLGGSKGKQGKTGPGIHTKSEPNCVVFYCNK